MKAKDFSYPQGQRKGSDDDEKPMAKYTKETELVSTGYPTYQNITAVYLPANAPNQQFYSHQNPEHEGIIMSGIVQGVPVTHTDINAIRTANQSLQSRRAYWNYRRKVQSFVCLNIFYAVVLVISINANMSDYREYKDFCPNFSNANLHYGVLSIVWIAISLIGVSGAMKRNEKMLKGYMGAIYILILLTVIATGLGLINQDEGEECETEPSKALILIGNGIFTVVILTLFAYSTAKLRKLNSLITPPQQQNIALPIQGNLPFAAQSDPIPIQEVLAQN